MSRTTRTLGLLLTVFITLPAPGEPDHLNAWLQWRGPTRDGQFGAATWPNSLDASQLKESWRVPMGESYSGPIVTSELVFSTETRNKKTEFVRAFDRANGEQIWETSWEGAIQVPFFANANGSWIRSTPACDESTLFVGGIRDVLVAIDARTGKTKWRIDFAEKTAAGVPKFGCVCSPIVDGTFVYMHAGDAFHKIHKADGAIVWQALQGRGGMMGGAFSSPLITEIDGQRMVLVQGRESLVALDEATGEELWSHAIETFRGMNILTPTLYENAILTSAYGGKAEMIQALDENEDGAVEVTWTNKKLEGYMSSPVVIGDHAYLLLKNQRFACIDLKTGNEAWRTNQQFGKYWSLIASGDKILALDERGELLLIRANPDKFELLDSRKISESPTWAHLAVAGNQLFVRELNALVAYRWE